MGLSAAEDTLWTGTPGNYTDRDAPSLLSQVRKLVNNGQYAEATALAANLSGHPSNVMLLLIVFVLCFDNVILVIYALSLV